MVIPRTAASPDVSTHAPVQIDRPDAASRFVLVCEHASNHVPPRYADLGLDRDALESHIAWDPGALALARHLSSTLDASLVHAGISRLVYDCNRPPEAASAMPAVSEDTPVPGNQSLTSAERDDRARSIYLPFHAAVDAQCRRLLARGITPVIVTLHSFTPVYFGQRRDVQVGVLHDSDVRLADAMLTLASRYTSLDTRRNAPYGPGDGVTHTLVRHALGPGWLNVMLEVRNDLLQDADAVRRMADVLSGWLPAALALAGKDAPAQGPAKTASEDHR